MRGGKGLYLGTEVDGKWWKRYGREPFFARGNGTWHYNDEEFRFLKYLSGKYLVIPRNRIVKTETGKWHAGRWGAGMPILKIIWMDDGKRLSSGFLLSADRENILYIASSLGPVRSNEYSS